MSSVYEGDHTHPSARFGIVVSRWNLNITQKLLNEACAALERFGVGQDRIEVAWVPGSWEIPVAAKALTASGRVDAVICLGAILKGETPHDVELSTTVSNTLGELAVTTSMPITWGILHCETLEQAMERAGGNEVGVKRGNKGAEAAQAALEMVSLLERIQQGA